MQLTRSENCTNQIAKLSASHSSGGTTIHDTFASFVVASEARNGVVVDVWNIWNLLVQKIMMRGILYTSYDEGTYCTPVMMGPLHASYDEGTYCMPVMMRGRIVTPAIMRGSIVRQL